MDKFNLTFDGEILEGFELTEVKKHFAAALLINDPERILHPLKRVGKEGKASGRKLAGKKH